MNDVTRALKNWQDYKEIRVSGDSKPTANAVYELENTENFAGIYRNPTPDKDLGIELVLLKLREFL